MILKVALRLWLMFVASASLVSAILGILDFGEDRKWWSVPTIPPNMLRTAGDAGLVFLVLVAATVPAFALSRLILKRTLAATGSSWRFVLANMVFTFLAVGWWIAAQFDGDLSIRSPVWRQGPHFAWLAAFGGFFVMFLLVDATTILLTRALRRLR